MRVVNFLDLETTGGNDPDHRIIETCCGLFDLDTEQELELKTWRSNPMRAMDRRALKAHGITLDELAGEPTWDLVAPEIANTVQSSELAVAHNGDDFDFPFLDRELRRVGVVIPFPRTFDTMKHARWATHNGKLPRLGELCTALDVAYDPSQAHAADYDVRVMAKCFFEARRLGFFTLQ